MCTVSLASCRRGASQVIMHTGHEVQKGARCRHCQSPGSKERCGSIALLQCVRHIALRKNHSSLLLAKSTTEFISTVVRRSIIDSRQWRTRLVLPPVMVMGLHWSPRFRKGCRKSSARSSGKNPSCRELPLNLLGLRQPVSSTYLKLLCLIHIGPQGVILRQVYGGRLSYVSFIGCAGCLQLCLVVWCC